MLLLVTEGLTFEACSFGATACEFTFTGLSLDKSCAAAKDKFKKIAIKTMILLTVMNHHRNLASNYSHYNRAEAERMG